MSAYQHITIVGNLGRDPELKSFPNGGQTCTVSVAVNETWKTKDGDQKEHTEWFNVTFNDKLAEIVCKYLNKGSKVLVDGKLRTRKYQDKDGREVSFTELRADTMRMLDGKQSDTPRTQERAAPRTQQPAAASAPASGGSLDDDVPFRQRSWKEG